MWFLLGLVSLSVCIAYQIRYRWNLRWAGGRTEIRGIPCLEKYLRNKHGTTGLQVGFVVPDAFRFELKRETWVDRFFKWVGLSVEKQFGQAGFDRLVYVASNDEHLINRVADSPELRTAAQRLFLVDTHGCRIRRVHCAHGSLWVDIRRGTLFSRKDDDTRLNRCAAELAPHLYSLARELKSSMPTMTAAPERDRFLFRAVVLLSLSSGLAINGLIFLFRALVLDNRFTMDVWALWIFACYAGATVVGVLLLANLWLLGRSARAHLVLLELLLVGSFGAITSSAAELRDANMEWDRGTPVLLEPPITHKTISRSRRGGASYYLHVPDWYGDQGSRRIKVSSGFYRRAQVGQILEIEQYPGYFGIRWAELRGLKTQTLVSQAP